MPRAGRSPGANCGISGFPSDSGYSSTSTYDVLDNLTQSVQGSQTRSLAYDGLSRLTNARILEVSTSTDVTYAYDPDSDVTSVTDPRGTVYFEYDALHRVTKKKHGSVVVATYAYDGSTNYNQVGRLVTERDGDVGSGADQTDYTYDVMGRALTANRSVSGVTYNVGYAYDLLGDPVTVNYPSSSGLRRLVKYYYKTSGELDAVKDETNGGNIFSYVSGSTYSPLGALQQMNLNNSVTTALGWNPRGQLTSLLTQKTGGSTYLNLGYGYFNDGSISQITNNLDSQKTEKFTYDELLRLLTAQRGPDNNIQRKYSYDYDRYGNRWAQTLVAGTGFGGSHTFDPASNRLAETGFTYDNSGNLTANGPGTSYTYSMESLMLTFGSSVTYAYDAQQRRAKKTVSGSTTDYFYSGSQVMSEKQGSTWTDYIFFQGQRIAIQTGALASTVTYLHTDHLGSVRVATDSTGASAGSCDYEPFGETQQTPDCSLPTKYRFTGAEYESETGLYHLWFRQYDAKQGRWMSVDPLAGDPGSSQSMNRYAHVMNNPANFIDPMGLQPCKKGTPGYEDDCPRRAPGAEGDVDNQAARMEDLLELIMNGFDWCTHIGESMNTSGWSVGCWFYSGGPAFVAGPKPKPTPANNCVQPTAVQRAAISTATVAAKFWGKTLLWGLGGSAGAGFGKGWGMYGSVSLQIAVSPNGNAAYVATVTAPAAITGRGTYLWITPSTKGFGALGGAQFGFSNATDPSQLAGPAVDASASLAAGLGIGGDISTSGSTFQANVTLGFGTGGRGSAGAVTNTAVIPFCHN